MHRIVKAHLESFAASFSLEADDEAKQFEKFATYSVLSNRFSGGVDENWGSPVYMADRISGVLK